MRPKSYSTFFCSNFHSFIHYLNRNNVCNLMEVRRELKNRVFCQHISRFITATRDKSERDRIEGSTQHAYVIEYLSESNHRLFACDYIN